MSVDKLLRQIVAASKKERSLTQRRDQARIERDQAIWRLYHEEGLGYGKAATLIREAMLSAGFSEQELDDRNSMGLSTSSVRKVVAKPMPQTEG